MKQRIYIETSIISYLTSNPSRDVVISANQILVKEWWEEHRNKFDLYISEIVYDESEKGDEKMAKKRLKLIEDLPFLDFEARAKDLAKEILKQDILPQKAAYDVFHISIATIHEVDFLLTLNCKHIANAFILRRVEKVCRDFGYEPPIVCTPQEILEKENEIDEG